MDAVLATRGWGADEFRLASPELRAACHWLVIAEKAVPVFVEQRAIAEATPDKSAGAEAWSQRLTAIEYVNSVRPWLYPEDDGG